MWENVLGWNFFMAAKSFPRKPVCKTNILGKIYWKEYFGPKFCMVVELFPRIQVCNKNNFLKTFENILFVEHFFWLQTISSKKRIAGKNLKKFWSKFLLPKSYPRNQITKEKNFENIFEKHSLVENVLRLQNNFLENRLPWKKYLRKFVCRIFLLLLQTTG